MENVTSDRKEVDFARLLIGNIDNTWPLYAPFLPQAVREALWKKKRETQDRQRTRRSAGICACAEGRLSF